MGKAVSSEYMPSISVTVPMVVPLKLMFTKGSGSPDSKSFTVPSILVICAEMENAERRTAKNAAMDLCRKR